MKKIQKTFYYKNKKYPDYIKRGNAVENITPFALKFCKGRGVDIGGTPHWHFPGAEIINPKFTEYDAMNLPEKNYDYIFSSHCLEHLENYIEAIEYWKKCLRKKGQLFLYLPHPDMEYWLPQNCRKHLHKFEIHTMIKVFSDLGFEDVFYSQRDLYYSFAITGVKK